MKASLVHELFGPEFTPVVERWGEQIEQTNLYHGQSTEKIAFTKNVCDKE